ncbi:MAG TPA: M56 family metallopeptidase [Acidobacteriota bacterium]|nr:M56 family metallopeptidase [Acidobacteriota bacterium]
MIESQLIDLEPCIRTVATILMHSLWQGILIGILAAVALSLLRSSNAKIRYAVSCSAMAAVIVAAAVTAVSVRPDGYGPARHVSAVTGELASGEGSSDVGATINTPAPTNGVSSSNRWWKHPSISRYIFMIWIAGVMLFSVYHLLGWRRARGFVRRGTSSVPPEWQARFEKLCDEFRVRRLVSFLSSSLVKVPCVVGWMKPVILVPVSMFASLDPSEIEMILVHELAHVRRYDVLVNIVQTAVETLFFFNPAIWWLSRQIRTEREDCCDDTAILRTGNRLRYARALANLEELRMFQTSFGTALTGTPLRRRIRRIVGATKPRFYSSVLSISGMLVVIPIIAVFLGSFGGSNDSAVQASEKIEATQTFDPGPGDLRGEWEIESDHDKLYIRFNRGRDSRIAFSFDRNEFFDKIGDGQQTFQLIRDAGTFFLDGRLGRNGRNCWGEGEWYFQPDSEFVHFMNPYGLRGDDKEKVLATAIFDVSREFISGLEGYSHLSLDVDKLISARSQGITPEYIEEFRKTGYTDLPYDRLLSMRVQGVTPDDAREFERLGVGHLTADQLISARIHGITPKFVEEFRDAGFRDLSYKSFVTLRAFNLDVGDFEDCYRHRFMDVSEDNMVWVCGFDITQKDVEEMKERGYKDIDGIIEMLAKKAGK